MKILQSAKLSVLIFFLYTFSSGLQAADEVSAAQQIVLKPEMFTVVTAGTIDTLVDEQDTGKDPVMNASTSAWKLSGVAKDQYPLEFIVDLGAEHHLSNILFWDLNGHGNIKVEAGEPGNWKELLVEDGVGFKKWKFHNDLNAKTRYLRLVKESADGAFGEMLVYEYTPEQAQAALDRAKQLAEEQASMGTAQTEASQRPLVDSGTLFGKLPLVDEIDPASDAESRTFLENPAGVSKVESILGQKVRTIPNQNEEPAYFAFRVGEGKLLEPGKAYLLTVEFPEDESRTFVIANRGGDLVRGVQTGQSLGDSIFGFTSTNLESLKIPLSGKFETFQQLFWLNDRFAEVAMPRGESEERKFSPVRGFLVLISQWGTRQTPASKGAAVGKIRLFEVPEPEKFNVALKLPPKDLPQRHLFYREEMADGVVNSREPGQRSVDSIEDWYEYHFRNMNFLGMNTFAKDLLEFGAPQHWDVENGQWYNQSKFPDIWEKILPKAKAHGLSVLPYYEYAGSSGKRGLAQKSKDLVQPLSGKGDFTHIRWAESKQVDVTDPQVLDEFKRVLDLTILKFKDQANFVGAWIRPRISQMPISFADPTRERFAQEANNGTPVSREELQADSTLLSNYYAWWNGKRKEFLVAVQAYLKENQAAENPLVLFTSYYAEPAPSFKIKGNKIPIVTDDPLFWNQVAGSGLKDYDRFVVLSEEEVLNQQLYKEALLSPAPTFGNWEWHHAGPRPDPQDYTDTTGIVMTYPFNREFTVNEPESLDLFKSKSGLAIIRHYPLNENTMGDELGYFVTDVDRPGPYGMLAEALAVANSDPWQIGYMSGHIYNRPFPDAVRRFNANFLALPALPSTVVTGAASKNDIVVRHIDAGAHGSYFAIVNTAMTPAKNVTIKLPKAGQITEAATGTVLAPKAAQVTLDLEPYELRSLHVQ